MSDVEVPAQTGATERTLEEPTASEPQETIPETAPETAPETIPGTELETIPETVPETAPTKTQPVPAGAMERYNRAATAQISYPDRKETALSGAAALLDAVQNLFGGDAQEEPPSFQQQITPSRLRTQVLYENVFPGVDLQYELYSYHVKESILVKEPLPRYAFSFQLGLSGLTPTLQEDGSILLSDADETIRYCIPAPYMIDANHAYSEAVSYQLRQQADGAWVLTVTADKDWIESPERVFPVCIDPTLVDETTSKNFVGTVCTEAGSAVSVTTNLACGYHPDHKMMEIYYKLTDLPKIPAGHTMVRAQAGFYQNDFRSGDGSNDTSGTMVLYMSEITQSAALDSSMTWANRPDHGPVLDYINTSSSTVNDILLWDITPAAKSWYDGGHNYGLVMTSNATATTKTRTWLSYYDEVYFVVSYRNTNGIEDYYTYQTMGIGNAGTAYIGDFSGQLTLCKHLLSYASTVNPVSLDLVYNSSYAMRYGEENYDTGGWMNLEMHLGAGVNLSVMQHVEKIELQNDTNAGNKSTYMKYTDGDGTVHYFAKDSSRNANYYYDEDGMGLKINEYQTGCYRISDDKNNEMFFVNGHLTCISDANGNEIQIHYIHGDNTVDSDGNPRAYGDRINKIIQVNDGGSAVTVATFAYSSDKWLQSITDAAGNVYKFTYSNKKLSKISRGGTVLAQYGTTSTRMSYAYDAEAQYGVAFTYSAGKVNSYYEITSASTASKPGAIVEVGHLGNGQTLYRDYGADRTKSSDDILTYYTFDYAGRSVNAYTTDTNQHILGASNAVYSGVGSTDKANNRTLRTAQTGVAAMNELRNYGFESAAPAWSFTGANGTDTNILSKAENPRTGANACKGWIRPEKSNTIAAYRSIDTLQANVTYTLSAYVNTTQCTSFSGQGVYLQVSGNGITQKSNCINYQTSSTIDGGWVRLSVTFTPTVKGTYTIGVYNHGAGPYFFADDFQLEQAESPSSLNLLENGNLQDQNYGWNMGPGASYATGTGLNAAGANAYSIQLKGSPSEKDGNAWQNIPIRLPGTQTYVLSGWGKANAVPDNVMTASSPDFDQNKQFGLRAGIYYTDGTKEYHYAPFNSDVTQWQFTSVTIVPRHPDKTISVIKVLCAYEKNANTAYFDNLSLVMEAAQTMKYDSDGNLVSVKSTGSDEQTRTFSSGNLKTLKTGGSGTFTYTYDSSHNLKTATNGIVTETMTYDASGNVLDAILSSKSGTDKIVTTNSYTNNKNLLACTLDARGNTVAYTYGTDYCKMSGQPEIVRDPGGTQRLYDYGGPQNKIRCSYIANTVSLNYNYDSKGYLAEMVRGGWLPGESGADKKQNQSYTMTYDSFGNRKTIAVGTRTLMRNTYAAGNGQLTQQAYGNGDTVSFSYDSLGRTTQTNYSDGRTLDYTYNGNGQLHTVKDQSSGVVYAYTYDMLDRLISSQQSGPNTNIRNQYVYDTNNRLTRWYYAAPGLSTVYETFTYNSSATDSISDGALTSMRLLTGDSMTFGYDTLSRLKTRKIAGQVLETYSYTPGSTTNPNEGRPPLLGFFLRCASGVTFSYRFSGQSPPNMPCFFLVMWGSST